MKKLISFLYLVTSVIYGNSQSLGGYDIYDYLVDAVHPYGCVSTHLTGPPDDSTWVNFLPNDTMTGDFGLSWINVSGNELLLETSYHKDNYDVRLLLSNGEYSSTHNVSAIDWETVTNIQWTHLQFDCANFSEYDGQYILPLDFSLHFGLSSTDIVTGIEIVFLETNGAPDLAGVYIITEPICDSFNLGNDIILCQDDTLTLDVAYLNASYLWQDSSTNSTFTITQEGTYWVEAISNSCITGDTINVSYIPLPDVELGNDTILCQEESLTLDATTLNATYLWQDSSISSINTLTEPGVYWVEVTTDNCSTIDTINISYNPLNAFEFGNDTVLCQGETLTLDATIINTSYLWQDNSINSVLNVINQGVYWVEITLDNCSTSDTINVNFNLLPVVDLVNDTSLCQGDSLIIDATTSEASYLWFDNSTNSSYLITQQGEYWVEVIVNNCSTTENINIDYNPLPYIELGNDTVICHGDNLILNATTFNASYLWQDNSTNSIFAATDQGKYWVTINVDNCLASDSILIVEDYCEINLELPNVFTPNNDGINDMFVPVNNKGITSMNTFIYNRWGDKIFESNKLSIEWDGGEISDGVYFWIVYFTDLYGNENNLSGNVRVFR